VDHAHHVVELPGIDRVAAVALALDEVERLSKDRSAGRAMMSARGSITS
jgi:hypothetical protein